MANELNPALEAPEVPATDAPADGAKPVAERTYAELAREIHEFGRQFPMPERGDSRGDARWFEEHLGTPTFEPYRGNFIAVLNESIVGHGRNALQLQLDVARKFNVHPHRLIVEYVPRAEF
jgi:hypothetical protein